MTERRSNVVKMVAVPETATILTTLDGGVLPAAAQGLDEKHARHQALALDLRRQPLALERGPLGVHHLEIAHEAGRVTGVRELRRPPRGRDRARLRFRLLGQDAQARKAVLDLLERDEQ